MPTLSELLAVATEAAYLGGRRTLAYFNAGVAVETKADDTPVTVADREAEQVIRARISRSFPNHSIIGEEGGETAGDAAYRWIIDPIDGTKTFIHGVPFYGVLVGVEVAGEPAVGAVYLPAFDEMISAAIANAPFAADCTANRAVPEQNRDFAVRRPKGRSAVVSRQSGLIIRERLHRGSSASRPATPCSVRA